MQKLFPKGEQLFSLQLIHDSQSRNCTFTSVFNFYF
jgi:hypothetical protein